MRRRQSILWIGGQLTHFKMRKKRRKAETASSLGTESSPFSRLMMTALKIKIGFGIGGNTFED